MRSGVPWWSTEITNIGQGFEVGTAINSILHATVCSISGWNLLLTTSILPPHLNFCHCKRWQTLHPYQALKLYLFHQGTTLFHWITKGHLTWYQHTQRCPDISLGVCNIEVKCDKTSVNWFINESDMVYVFDDV